jgi:hypothetical protein
MGALSALSARVAQLECENARLERTREEQSEKLRGQETALALLAESKHRLQLQCAALRQGGDSF